MRSAVAVGWLVVALTQMARADGPGLPKVAEGWSIEVVAKAPAIAYPTALVTSPDGTVYLGQDPMDMPGPSTEPIDSVVSIVDGKVATFADKLWAVMGLEWVDGTLYVVHAPYLSAFRDEDGDGRAENRVDLITGLGPRLPGSSGLNDHVASGLRLGMDGFLYVAVGDKGIPKGVGRDGRVISMSTGGVIRIRPDGSGLEVVSTGERNPLSVALTALDDVFTYGNDDDSKRWPNSLTHHIVGGHYGYPYEFLTAPFRALPIVEGHFGGAGAQGICYNEDGLPTRFRGNLIFCDWGSQSVTRMAVEPVGATFRVASKEVLVEKGTLADFRPFSIATHPRGDSFYLSDWACNGWRVDGPKVGRLFRMTYTGSDRVSSADRSAGLEHPALRVRLEAQRGWAAQGARAVDPLAARLESGRLGPGRVHALWALDAIGTPSARSAIRAGLGDSDAGLRAQSARSSGVRRDPKASASLRVALRDPSPMVRREAAIALGRLGDKAAGDALHDGLGDTDPVVAWSIRRAIRTLEAWDARALSAALAVAPRREDALKLADESWNLAAVQALGASLAGSADPAWKSRVVSALAGNYRRYPAWSGRWFGTNPVAGAMPKKTVDWDPSGMDAVLAGLVRGFRDADPAVRRQAIGGLIGVGGRASPLFLAALASESDPINLAAMARALGSSGEAQAAGPLGKLLNDSTRPLGPRIEALDALAGLRSREAVNSRLMLAYDKKAPVELVSRALPALGRTGIVPSNDLEGFLYHKSDLIRAAAIEAYPTNRPLPEPIKTSVLAALADRSSLVVKAAIDAVGAHGLVEGVPRLIELASSDETRVEATRSLAGIPDPRAFTVFVASLSDRDPQMRKLGESSLVAIRDSTAVELESLAKAGKFSGPAALSVERILGRFHSLNEWRVIGPFPRTIGLLFADAASIDFDRKMTGPEGGPIAWQARSGEPGSGRVLLDDLKAKEDGLDLSVVPDLSAFAVTVIPSDRERTSLLLVGSSGSISVQINDQPGVEVTVNAGRTYAADSDLVRVRLKKGANRLLIRSRQGVGAWCFSVQVSEGESTAPGPNTAGLEGLRAFALSHRGDARRGEAIFFESKGIGCSNCHAVAERGTSHLGPDLAGLAAKYDKAEIVRSILEPSSRIATGYQPLVIAGRDGTVVTGLLRLETETHLDLVDSDRKPIRIAKANIEARRVGQVSTMPSGLVDSLSPVEFADLIEFLAGQKTSR